MATSERQRYADDPEFRQRKKEQNKAWRERNRERVRNYKQFYYQQNHERLLEGYRRYNQKNAEARKAYHREYWKVTREARHAYRQFRAHGLRPDDWVAMWAAQDGRCYLCGTSLAELEPRFVHVDHDHSCCPRNSSCAACRRGLACHSCNTAVGLVLDDPERLRRMADALETAQAAVERRKAVAGQQLTLDLEA